MYGLTKKIEIPLSQCFVSNKYQRNTSLKMSFYNQSHLKNENILDYAERHLTKGAVNIIKDYINRGIIPKRGYRRYYWGSGAEYAEEDRQFYEKNVNEYYDRYQRYDGDKRDSLGRELRKQWNEACVDLLRAEFMICWHCERDGI